MIRTHDEVIVFNCKINPRVESQDLINRFKSNLVLGVQKTIINAVETV